MRLEAIAESVTMKRDLFKSAASRISRFAFQSVKTTLANWRRMSSASNVPEGTAKHLVKSLIQENVLTMPVETLQITPSAQWKGLTCP
jgi:hypothetical protein